MGHVVLVVSNPLTTAQSDLPADVTQTQDKFGLLERIPISYSKLPWLLLAYCAVDQSRHPLVLPYPTTRLEEQPTKSLDGSQHRGSCVSFGR